MNFFAQNHSYCHFPKQCRFLLNHPVCLRWGIDPTTWTSSPSSSASLQPWTAAPHLPTIAVMSLRNFPSSHSVLQSSRYPKHVIFGVHIITNDVVSSFVVLCAKQSAEIPNYSTTSERRCFVIILQAYICQCNNQQSLRGMVWLIYRCHAIQFENRAPGACYRDLPAT